MRGRENTTRAGFARPAVALLVAVATVLALPVASVARPTKSDVARARASVAAARAKLNALNYRQTVLDEQYDQARIALATAQQKLAEARAAAGHAASTAKTTQADLSSRVRAAYEGAGSELGALLGAGSLSDFSDRVEFLNQIAANDATIVARANVAGQRAQWAAAALATAVKEQTSAVETMQQKRSQLVATVSAQEQLIGILERKLHHALHPPPPPPPPVPLVQATSAAPAPAPSSTLAPPPAPSPPPPLPDPPPASSRAQVAIQAAESQIGVPYVYGGSTPGVGFDCSGLTMWAWGQAGVSLPHSSAAQYDALPHVDRSQLQPGDLLFFYSPISHVAMYLGGDQMIEAPHTGLSVRVVSIYWQYYVGAARPG